MSSTTTLCCLALLMLQTLLLAPASAAAAAAAPAASAFMPNGRFGKRFSPFLSAFDEAAGGGGAAGAASQRVNSADLNDYMFTAVPGKRGFMLNGRYGKRSGGSGAGGVNPITSWLSAAPVSANGASIGDIECPVYGRIKIILLRRS